MHHQKLVYSGPISFCLTSGGQLPVDGCPTWLWWACPWWTWCPWWLWLWCVLAWWLSGLALCPWPKGDVILFWPGILFACMRAMLDNTVSQPSNPAWWCKQNIKAKAELSKIGINHTSIWFDLVTSSVSTMWALFKSNKSTMSKCFYKNKPFQIILISASTKGTKVIIFRHDCARKQWWDGGGGVKREQRNWHQDVSGDEKWFALTHFIWSRTELLEWCVIVAVWMRVCLGKTGGTLHSGLGVTDEITPTQIIGGQGLKVEAWQSVKLTFLGVGMSRFAKSPQFVHLWP